MTQDSNPCAQVALLVCDTPMGDITSRYGDFGDNARDLLTESTSAGDRHYTMAKYQVAFEGDPGNYMGQLKQTYDLLRENIASGVVKGVLLTGSRSDSFDSTVPWIKLLDEFIVTTLYHLENFPIVGICFGHQILAKNLGCKVGRNLPEVGWEVGTTTINLNKEILTIEKSPFVSPLTCETEEECKINDHLNLVEFHRDVVFGLPPTSITASINTKFQSIGSTAKCSIQGLITESGPIKLLTFQGHPEFPTHMALEILLLDYETNKIEKSLFEKATYNTKILNNQGPVVGRVINTFLNTYAE